MDQIVGSEDMLGRLRTYAGVVISLGVEVRQLQAKLDSLSSRVVALEGVPVGNGAPGVLAGGGTV